MDGVVQEMTHARMAFRLGTDSVRPLFSDLPKPLHGICGLNNETFAVIERRKRPVTSAEGAKL